MALRRPCWSLSTNRFKLVVAYDGTDFRGWAAQPGQRTVQGTLKEAVRRVSGEDCEIVGASRTDSGAHAEGQVCHFDCSVPIPAEKWTLALNRVLPSDLKVRESRLASLEFHSRFAALDREYVYVLYAGLPEPRRERYAHHVGKTLDLKAMRQAAKSLEGTNDYLAFTEELDPSVQNTVRTLFEAKIGARSGEIRFRVRGTAFLRGMMRRMAGGLLEVGLGRRPPEDIAKLLDPNLRDSVRWPVVLPAKGLTLMRVRYGPHPKDNRRTDSGED